MVAPRGVRAGRVPGLLAALLVVTACGSGGDPEADTSSSQDPEPPEGGGPVRTLTEEEAAERAEDHLQRAVEALPEKPTLTVQDESSSECLDPTDHGPRGRYEVGKSYWLDDMPSDRNEEFVDALYEHWETDGFRVLTDKRSKDDRFVSVEHNEDAFRMSVKESIEGDLSLGASSPCVWPEGTPPEDAG